MKQEQIEIMFAPNSTEQDRKDLIAKEIEKIKQSGGYIIAGEPIEKIFVKIIGTRFTVEKP